jgi:outer membrane usher protein
LAAFAQRSPAADPEPVQATLELIVNTVDKGTALVAFSGDHVLVASSELEKAGIHVEGGTRIEIANNSFIDLASLAPAVNYKYNESNLSLALTVDPRLLGASEIDLQRAPPPAGMSFVSSPSAFLNYAFNSIDSSTSNSASLFLEQGANISGAFFDNGITLNAPGTFTRGNTSIVKDNRDDLTRWTLGDISTASSTLGGLITMGGIGYSKDFAINPYFLAYPTQRFSGVVNTPSTADIYVNGQLIRTVDLPPGTFDLLNIPGISGAGVTRVVVRDAFGQRQDLTAPYYQSAQLLSQGLSQFSYDAGFTRTQVPSHWGQYELPAASAVHDYGFTNSITAGGFLQTTPKLIAGGPEITLRLPVGQLGFAGGASSGQAPFGWSGLVGYNYQTTLFNIGVNATYMSDSYATLSLEPTQDRARWQATSFVGVSLGPWDVLLQATPSRYRDSGRNDQASIRADRRFTDFLSASATLGQSRLPHSAPDTSILFSINYSFAPNSIATVSASMSHEGGDLTAQASRSLPIGPGYGYSVQAQTGQQPVDMADLQYQTTYGTYEVDGTRTNGMNTARISASGSVVGIGNTVKFSTPLSDAYGLIRVPGVAGVEGYRSNLEVGRTDANGDLLVPNLISYYGNRLEINDQDVPMNYGVDATERVVAPGYRSGAVVDFPVHRYLAYSGTLAIRSKTGTKTAAFGELEVVAGGTKYDSPVGEHGEFYLDGLPPGSYPATIAVGGESCAFTFVAPPSDKPVTDMKEVTCDEK